MVAEPTSASAGPAEVAAVARLVARAGLCEAFGHVSARRGERGLAITPTTPLGAAEAASIHELDGPEGAAQRRPGQPLEAPLHAAIYAARPEVAAIVRTHSPAVVALGTGSELPPVTHGLAGLAGELARHDDPQLVDSPERAEAAARALGAADCLVMHANGALATGATLGDAAVRAWFLEERARVWLQTRAEGLDETELAQRAEHWQAERERAWQWLQWRFGDGATG